MNVVLYSKSDCGLCDEAERVLRRLQPEIRFELEVVDIESEDKLFDRYWDKVPVVVVEGKEVAVAPVDARELRAVLAS